LKNNRSSEYGDIQYRDAASDGGAGESAKLIIGTEDDADDDILVMPSDGEGIYTFTPVGNKLYLNEESLRIQMLCIFKFVSCRKMTVASLNTYLF
jgi:hypothetical protein